jgi:AcrR family transcriptional regulator
VATDRRIGRTRRLLADALIALVLERGYERLTVQDVLDRADVGRSTFYAHYRDKESLLLACFEELRAGLAAALCDRPAGRADPASVAALLFDHAERQRPVYRALCGRESGRVVLRHLHGLLADALRPGVAGSGARAEAVVQACASAAVGLLSWWVEEDFPLPAAELAATYGRLLAGPPGGVPPRP